MSDNRITFIYGADNMPIYAIDSVTNDLCKEKDMRIIKAVFMSGEPHINILNNSGITEEHMEHMIECFLDHIKNVAVTDYTEYDSRVPVVTSGVVARYVSIYKGEYYGPNCVADVYYVSG